MDIAEIRRAEGTGGIQDKQGIPKSYLCMYPSQSMGTGILGENDIKLKDRVTVVTGGDRAIALALAENGAQVMAVSNVPEFRCV